MQGPGPNQLNMTNSSMNMPSSSHGSMGGYNHSVPSSQSMPVQNQMTMSQGQPMGNYGPRPNMNMQPNQGTCALPSPSFQLCPLVPLLPLHDLFRNCYCVCVRVHLHIYTHERTT